MINARAKRTLIALLPAVALTACVSQSKYDALQTQYDQLNAQHQADQQKLAALSAQQGRLQNSLRLVVNDDLAFKSGSWELSATGERTMAQIARQLAPYQQRPILISGYTDNQPIGNELRQKGVDTNEQLSQKRAEAVMAYLAQHGVKQDMMSTKGWGDAQPVASNGTSSGRAQNRRVEITFADQGSSGSSAALP
jgi:chemotaxis protein MotB